LPMRATYPGASNRSWYDYANNIKKTLKFMKQPILLWAGDSGFYEMLLHAHRAARLNVPENRSLELHHRQIQLNSQRNKGDDVPESSSSTLNKK